MFLNMLPSATPLHILDGFTSSFAEMPNRALAFVVGVARQGKVGRRAHWRPFLPYSAWCQRPLVSPIVRGKRGEREGGGREKERNL